MQIFLDKIQGVYYINAIERKGCDEEEYALPLKRESGCPKLGAERLLEGKGAEGSFQAGSLKRQ